MPLSWANQRHTFVKRYNQDDTGARWESKKPFNPCGEVEWKRPSGLPGTRAHLPDSFNPVFLAENVCNIALVK